MLGKQTNYEKGLLLQGFSIVAHPTWQGSWRACAPNSPPKPQLDLCSTKKTTRLILVIFLAICLGSWLNPK